MTKNNSEEVRLTRARLVEQMIAPGLLSADDIIKDVDRLTRFIFDGVTTSNSAGTDNATSEA